jgi:outer membrane protein OmpA-like peptidoglycan-associated protein
VNARLAFGGLLLLGVADLGLINFKLGPSYAEEQAKLAMGDKPANSAKPPTSKTPEVAAPNLTAAPPRPEPTTMPTPTAAESAAPAPSAVATAEPTPEPLPSATATAEPTVTATPEPTVAPTATVVPTATTPPPPPPPPPPPAPVAAGETPGAVEDIIFDLDSVRLNAAAKSILERVVQELKANPSLKVHVRGHSDRMGSREHNLELSQKRAASVENFLHGSGIPGSRVTTEAMGGRKPVDPNNTPVGWARNRRVEIEWR